MSDNENSSPADLMQAFEGAIESRIAPEAKPATADIDPRLRSVFITAVAQACDIVDLTPQQICEAFALLSVEGIDRALVERPVYTKTRQPLPAPEHLYTFDRMAPHKIPAITLPADEPDTPLGVYF